MQKHALILMTALLPTTGHADLIDFARKLEDTYVHVLISGRTFEPIPSLQRWIDLNEHYHHVFDVEIVHNVNNSAPQNPEDMPDGFWDWWRNEINANFPRVPQWDWVVASEPYGQNVADSLGATFLPYDIDRTLNSAKGDAVRKDMWGNWCNILPETRKRFQLKATFFGQESVGKTTVSKRVAELLGVRWLMEWARPYLEEVGEEVTAEKMNAIRHGQRALQQSFFNRAETPAIVLDTDLYSTLGYYPIMGLEAPPECAAEAHKGASDIYYVLPDDIPFTPDPLRYGGDVRESTIGYWTDLLDEHRQSWVMVPSGTVEDKAHWIAEDIRTRFEDKTRPIADFTRD